MTQHKFKPPPPFSPTCTLIPLHPILLIALFGMEGGRGAGGGNHMPEGGKAWLDLPAESAEIHDTSCLKLLHDDAEENLIQGA